MRGDEAQLYHALSRRVLRIVQHQVRTNTANIEDACHSAWVAFLRRSDHIERDATLSWITTTAIHEAYALIRTQQRTASLEQTLDLGGEPIDPSPSTRPMERAEQRERLQLVHRLPDRQRRIVLLQAAGLSYAEIARVTGDSERTVERQLYRARHSLAALARPNASAGRRLATRSLSTRGQGPVPRL